MATPHAQNSQPPMAPGLQNSYGPEMAAAEHNPGYGPQSIPGQYQGAPAGPLPPGYKPEAQNNGAAYGHDGATPAATTGQRKRILGLPVLWFWVLIGGIIVVLGVALGAGLGVGLSNRSSTSGSDSGTTASSSFSSSSDTAGVTTATPTPTTSSSSIASTLTTSTTSSSSSAAATGARVSICQNSYLDLCTTISVPASSCVNFPAAYNDAVSSVDTGGPTCAFYTGGSCTGDFWSTSGAQNLIPGTFNDAFSAVTCN